MGCGSATRSTFVGPATWWRGVCDGLLECQRVVPIKVPRARRSLRLPGGCGVRRG